MAQLITQQASTPYLVGKLLLDSAKLGPITQFYMAWRAAPYMFRGISASGAQQVIAAVDSGRRTTICIAQITADMVHLGFVDTVAGITSACVEAERPDAVAKVTIEMMLAGEMQAITLITNRLIARGEISEATTICTAMAEHGHGEFMQMVASDRLPAPLKAAKEQIDGAIAWVTGSNTEGGDNRDVAAKIVPEAEKKEAEKEEAEAVDAAAKEDEQSEETRDKEPMTAASIA